MNRTSTTNQLTPACLKYCRSAQFSLIGNNKYDCWIIIKVMC